MYELNILIIMIILNSITSPHPLDSFLEMEKYLYIDSNLLPLPK